MQSDHTICVHGCDSELAVQCPKVYVSGADAIICALHRVQVKCVGIGHRSHVHMQPLMLASRQSMVT